jgi:hypothetical protein
MSDISQIFDQASFGLPIIDRNPKLKQIVLLFQQQKACFYDLKKRCILNFWIDDFGLAQQVHHIQIEFYLK